MLRELLTKRNNPEKIAFIQGDCHTPYSTLMNQAAALSRRLAGLEGKNIALFLPNSSRYISALWGGLLAGACILPLNPQMTIHELHPLLIQGDIEAVITIEELRPLFDAIDAQERPPLLMIEDDASESLPPTAVQIDPDKAMMLFATSGTTAKAKIVSLTENNIAACVSGYLERVGFDRHEPDHIRCFAALPFSSAYGMMILTACLIYSIPIVISERPFSLTELYRLAQEHHVTHYEGGAAAIELMAQTAGRRIGYDISKLKYFGFGGSKVSGHIIEKVLASYPGVEIYQGYGMTEAAPLITKHPRGKVEKTDSVGRAIQGIEISIVTDSGMTKAAGIRGEIAVKGPNVMAGYYKNPSATDMALVDGYLYTGDIGYLDEEDYLYICGRKKSLIIVRGFNVYPEEVEACILRSRLAADCHVYGESDSKGEECLCVKVVPADSHVTAEAIREYCQGHLASYKWPRTILLCDTVEKTISGKIQRRKEKGLQ